MLYWVSVMVFNATFNNISAISWQSGLLEETGGPRENQRPVEAHCQTLSHEVNLTMSEFRSHNFSSDRH